jgi:3-oxoacyl-[acyl-carrier-protein] synthase II
MDRGFVISGIGFISPLGTGIDALWANICGGVSAFAPNETLSALTKKHTLAAVVPDDVINALLPAARYRRLPRYSRLALAAVAQCLSDLPLRALPKGFLTSRVGVFMGTSIGPLESVEHIAVELIANNPKAVNPLDFQESVYNAPLGHVSVHYGITGPCIALSSGDASGLAAMEMALTFLANEQIDLALVGGVDALTAFYYKGMSDLNVLTPGRMAPFARDRNGTILSEGAAFLSIENEEVNRLRNGRRYGRIAGVASACDGFSFYRNDPEGSGFRLAMENCLAASGLEARDIGAIVAAASGQKHLDRAEWLGIRAIWGDDDVPVTSLRGLVGDMGAGTALLMCALACEIFRRGVIPPTVPSTDSEFGLNILREPLQREVDALLLNEASWGGMNSSVILRRAE